jgi:hypothetical protein
MIIIPTREQFITHTHTHKTKTAQPTTHIGRILYSEKQHRVLLRSSFLAGEAAVPFLLFFLLEKKSSLIFF